MLRVIPHAQDEVSGCICGMVPGTEPRRKP